MATQIFAGDNDDYLPKDGSPNGTSGDEGWYIDLPRVMNVRTYREMPWRTNATVDVGRNVFICAGNPVRSNGNNLFHYCLNEHVNGLGSGNQVKLSIIRNLSARSGFFTTANWQVWPSKITSTPTCIPEEHNSLFCDGHAARFRNVRLLGF